ncbi:S-layer homology domain-containing protein [Lysinibacillus sp. NPDC056232]|uniref:S-layer homology domain-containing protein n=1 Tax=Lysinibacillus sp. NPDC056232 TaxID=3345756 RepID=UPI0035D7AEB3
MAKQNKGRKFFAASATAALVASAIVPVASAATSTIKDFDKVAPYAKEAVQALVDAGVISGDEKGNFNPTNSITRAEAAKIFTGALELEAEGDVDFKDVKKDAWYYDAIAATVEYGIFEGVSETEFAPNKNLTRSEAAKILVEAFELEGEADLKDFADASTVKPWAKSYLEIAVANGVIKGSEVNGKTNLNPNASITRQEFAVVFSRTVDLIEEEATVKVDKIEVVDAKTLNVTLSDGTKETITLEKALEPNKETEVTFTINDVEYKEKVTFVVTTATAVKSVSATNLKQVVVEFDGKVDPATAAEEGNYSITGSNDPEIDTAVVAEDGRSVTLTLKQQFENQAEYKLSLNNIKAGDKVLNEKDLKFKPLDNTVPTVSKVEALGNKTVRVQFSEPVKAAQTSQFQIDGKVVVGSIQTNLNTVIIKLSSALTDGEHTLTAEGTEDYNNFKTVKADTKFNVVEDKTPPTVASVVSASFEKVVLKFSEPVEQVFASNIYWMQGGAKKQASSVKQLTDDTFEFTFVGENKLVYTTDLYVTNVKDFSGNVIDKDTKVQVTPVIDQTRPEVISSTFVKDSNNKKIAIKFTKSLDSKTAAKAANYVIKDKDGKVQPISSTVEVKDKEVVISLLGTLKDNTDYTLTVTGVADNTTLNNVMLPYTTTLSVKDVTPPEFKQVTRLNNKQLYVAFNEAMATSGDGSIVDTDKYTVTAPDGTKLTIASFNVTQDSKGVILNFSKDIPLAGPNFTVKVQLVKDLAGNLLKDLTETLAVKDHTDTVINSVEATAVNKVEVEFSNPIQSLVQGDFSFNNVEIAYSELSTDGKTATFTLKSDLNEDATKDNNEVKLTVKDKPSTVDVLGKAIESITGKKVDDKIKATVDKVSAVANKANQIRVTFNEAVKLTADNAFSDFTVVDGLDSTNKVKVTDATLENAIDDASKTVILTVNTNLVSATVEVANPRFVTDKAGNVIAKMEPMSTETDKAGADAKTALNTAIATAQEKVDANADEGETAGQKVDGSKVDLEKALADAKTVNTNAASTLKELTDAKTALTNAIAAYDAATVADISKSLVAPKLSMGGTKTGTITGITAGATEVLNVTSAQINFVTVDAATGLKITAIAEGTSEITVQVKNAKGKVIKTGKVSVKVDA